eukprot:725564_1
MSQKVAKAPTLTTTSGYLNNQLPISLTPLSQNVASLPYFAGNTKYMPINADITPKYPKSHPINTKMNTIANETSLNYNFLINLTKYQQHTNSNINENKNNLNIIQCPNPTANPISNHQKQQQIQFEQNKHLRNANYMQQMEQKLNEQTQLIQNLLNQNTIFKSQITQQQNYISVIQNQNNILLNAYNSLTNTTSNNSKKGNGNVIETDDYRQWNVSDVINWISKLDNGKFLKYGYGFCLNNIDGKLLVNVTKDELNKMGVKNVNDKILLFNHIKKLKELNGQINTTNSVSNSVTNGCEGQVIE